MSKVAAACVSYASLPIILLAKFLLAFLLIVAAPLLHVARYLLYALWWTWRFLVRFETLYIYFGVAVLVGMLTGTLLYHSSTSLIAMLKLDTITVERGRTLSVYRAQKAERRAKKARQLMSSIENQPALDDSSRRRYSNWSKQDRGRSSKGLLSTIILEEDDSSDNGL